MSLAKSTVLNLPDIKPQNFEEKIVWYYIISTYGLYFLGAQRDGAATIAWILTIYLCYKLWYQTEDTPAEDRITIPFAVWVWIIGVLGIEIALIMGHLDWDLGTKKIITSTINWARQWALLALFPLVGCLKIRPQLLYRAACVLCFQSLIFIPIFYLASILHFGEALYISPLNKIGRGGHQFYRISLYVIDEANGQPRLALFAPWAPALGLAANIYLQLIWQESNKKWRWLGIIGASAMIWFTVSRLARLCLFAVPLATLWLSSLTLPTTYFATGIVSVFSGIFGTEIINFISHFLEQIKNQRASSNEVRKLLKDIAIYRWRNEAFIWGHGVIETEGPQIVANMPIGSHHTWAGILYTHGIVGAIAFAVPIVVSFVDLLLKAQRSKAAQAGLGILLVILAFSNAENLDVLSYLMWPGLLIMGIAFKENLLAPVKLYETQNSAITR